MFRGALFFSRLTPVVLHLVDVEDTCAILEDPTAHADPNDEPFIGFVFTDLMPRWDQPVLYVCVAFGEIGGEG